MSRPEGSRGVWTRSPGAFQPGLRGLQPGLRGFTVGQEPGQGISREASDETA